MIHLLRGFTALGLLAAVSVSTAPAAGALQAADGSAAIGAARAVPVPTNPDFFLGRPSWSVSARGGAFFPRADGQFYDFIFERFTVEPEDLTGFTGGLELGVWLGNHLELVAALDGAGVTRQTEYLYWEEDTGGSFLAIEQATRFRYGPTLGFGLKAYPLGRGESVGQFAWLPRRVSPFAVGTVGVAWWSLEQWGDWVVEEGPNTGDIFTDRFETRGTSRIVALGGGVDITLRPRVALTLDSRYLWGEGDLRGDFREFVQPLDLSGLRVTAGLSFRY